jgi:hypothetical protein
VRIHAGRHSGASFWKKLFPSMPSGKRVMVMGRSASQGSMNGAISR